MATRSLWRIVMRPGFPILAGLGLLLLASCQACPAEARALVLAPDFRSPETAGRTFLAGAGCDNASLEYRCLAEGLKEEYGATFDAYLLARPELREQLGGAAKLAFALEAVRKEDFGPDQVLVWWAAAGAERVGLLMERQHFFDVETYAGRRIGAFLSAPPSEWIAKDGRRLRIDLEDSVIRTLDPADVRQLVLGSEWKIREVFEPGTNARVQG
ncbi:MAG TPA: hypothetical protein VGC54_05010 [Planctomycetota bacterium]